MLCLEKCLDFWHWYLKKLSVWKSLSRKRTTTAAATTTTTPATATATATTATTPVNQPVKSHPWLQMPLEPGWAMAVSERPWRRVVTWHKIDDRYADFSWLLCNMKYLFWMHTKKYTTYIIKPVLLCMIVLSYFVFAFMDSLVCKV